MSVPTDVMTQISGAGGPLANADPMSQISQLSGDIQGINQKQADVSAQEAGASQQTLSQIEQLQPPQQNHKILDTMPWLIGLVALGGKATGLHAKTMLGATNGMVSGLLKGQQDAFDRSQKQYEDSRQKLLDQWKLTQQYYDTLYKSYGDQANAKEQAIKVARELSNDQWNHGYKEQMAQMKQGMDETKAWYMQQQLMQKIEEFDHKKEIDALKMQIAQQNADTKAKDAASKDQLRQAQIDKVVKTASGPDATKKIDGMITDVGKQMAALKKKYSDIETMSPEDKQQYEDMLKTMGQLEVGRKKLTPVPVSDPSELDGLEDGQHYVTPDGAERVKGGAKPQGNNPQQQGAGGVQPQAAAGSAGGPGGGSPLQKAGDLSQAFPNPLGGSGG